MGKIEINNRTKGKQIEYVINHNGCWECTSHRKAKGYPTIHINDRVMIMSRYIFERFVSKIPEGAVIRHKCDNKACINPEHLETGTPQENIEDKVKRNRQARQYGESNGNAKLTKTQVIEIRKDSRISKLIAKDYGVSSRNIRDIKSNKTWNIL